ncbi:clathrin light chain [Trichomonascus vanleenenianus]|uniref:clathrin light chain CLC1 n=1 Tax=Trichomonascus vanleenenianus TaxID=2268995 RepID=UPI003ECB085A
MSNFPSLEEIDKDLASTAQNGSAFEEDDFLSREKAVLGEDAEAFDKPTEATADDSVASFEKSFPSLNEQDNASALGPSGLISEPAEPYLPGAPLQTNEVTSKANELSLEDSEPIKEWRARKDLEIEQRDKADEQKRERIREEAKKRIDDFYENYNNKKDESIEQTRSEEKAFLEERDNDVAGVGNTWERISKLIDSAPEKTQLHDKSRFKELINSLKKDINAPGAAGY